MGVLGGYFFSCDWVSCLCCCVYPNGFLYNSKKKSSSTVVLLSFVISLLLVHRGVGEECVVTPLGMESGKIASSQISASSTYDLKSVGPQNARIRQELVGGAWCPKSPIAKDVREFIEVDLEVEHRITATETQGRFGNGDGKEFVEKLTFEYWRPSLGKWIQYRDSRGRTIFDGNENTYTGVKQEFNPPIFASKLRFIPHSIHPRTVCMRVELYGCVYEGGIVSYDVPQGHYSPKGGGDYEDFRDSLYDGQLLESNDSSSSGKVFLSGGRGILTDTIVGQKDFTQSRVNGWMGWKNESSPIKMQFHFDRLRKFDGVKVHVSNLIEYEAQVFASATVFSSVDGGTKVSKNPIVWIPAKNKTGAVVVELIPLKGIIASFLRLEFVHSNKWLLISEISFDSEPINADLPFETEAAHSLDSSGHELNHEYRSSNFSLATIVGVVIGCVSVCLVLSTAVASFCFLRRRNGRNTKLIGILGIPTPKSMSVGNGLNLTTSTNTNSTTTSGSSGGGLGGHISTISGGNNIAANNLGTSMNSHSNETLSFVGAKQFVKGDGDRRKPPSLTMEKSERKISLLKSRSKSKAMIMSSMTNISSKERLNNMDQQENNLIYKNDEDRLRNVVGPSVVGEYENVVGILNNKDGSFISSCKTLNGSSGGVIVNNVANVGGVEGGVVNNASTTSTVKATESDSSSSSGYASTFSQQLRRKRSGGGDNNEGGLGWRDNKGIINNGLMQFPDMDPTLHLPHSSLDISSTHHHNLRHNMEGGVGMRVGTTSSRFHPKHPHSQTSTSLQQSPLRCSSTSTNQQQQQHFLSMNAQAPMIANNTSYSPTVRRLILPHHSHEYSNASTVNASAAAVSYCPSNKINFNNLPHSSATPDIILPPPQGMIVDGPHQHPPSSKRLLGSFSSPKVNARRPSNTISNNKLSSGSSLSTITGGLMQRDMLAYNGNHPLLLHDQQEMSNTTARRAPYYYRDMVENSNNTNATSAEQQESENSYYAVCDIFNPNPYQDRRF